MTVRITKPEINITEKLSELDKPSGIAGEAMLRAETPQEQFNLIGAGRKNLIINGDFRVSQRGITGVAPRDGYGQILAPDRWATYRVGQRFTVVEEFVNDSYKKVLEVEPSNLGFLYLYQVIEDGSRLISDKDVTVSFWARADEKIDIRSGLRYKNDVNASIILNDDISQFELGTTWKYYTATMRLKDTQLGGDTSRNAWLMFFHDSPFQDPNKIYFADIQLELGKVATPFEHRSYGEELALCQRYYQFIGGSSYQALAQGLHYQAGTATMANIHFLKEMRVAPSISIRGDIIVTNRVSYDDPVTGLAGIASGKSSAFARFNTGITRVNDSPQLVAVANGADGGLQLDAEI